MHDTQRGCARSDIQQDAFVQPVVHHDQHIDDDIHRPRADGCQVMVFHLGDKASYTTLARHRLRELGVEGAIQEELDAEGAIHWRS